MRPDASHAPSGFFALRTPLLPLAEWLRWCEGLEAAGAAGEPERLAAAIARDGARLRERLRALVARPEVRDALFVASPDLEESLPLWLEQPEGERGQKVERALVRYFARLAGRPTPFGLFAGCSVGTVGARTHLALAGRERYARHTRLDMDYLFALAEALGQDPALRAALTWRPGSSLYRAAGRLRYAQARLDDKVRTHHLVAVEPSDYLVETLSRAQAGARPAELAAPLVDGEISREEAEGFIAELIDGQLLESELPPAVTGPEPVHGMIALLRGLPEGRAAAEALEGARAAIEELDAAGLGAAASRYRDVARGLERLPAKVELPRLFQVDLTKPAPEAMLGEAVVAELWRGVELLHRISPPPTDELKRFRDAFLERYEGREVPLLEALDEETGIGFQAPASAAAEGSPLLAGLGFPPQPDEGKRLRSAEAAVLLGKLEEATRAGSLEVELSAGDVEALEAKDRPPLPDALAVVATLVGSPEQVARGEGLLVLDGASGPSGARYLGRFCHGDPELQRHVEAHLRAEEALRPEAVFAEIVHLPEGRIGNILCRPVLRSHEVVYLGHSGAPPETQLPASDLRVRVANGRVVLRSARLGREVIPRLSSAHNFGQHSIGVYRFLCTLQEQGVASHLGWSWRALDSAPFLPRVRQGRLVLFRARWRLEKAELKGLAERHGAALFEAVQTLRARRRLPRQVALVQFDNVLPLDLENLLCLETFAQLVKGQETVTLREQLAGEDGLCVQGPEGTFVHELVVPFVRREPVGPARATVPQAAPTVRRSFPPGSAWLYAKLYTGESSADVLLRGHLAPLVEKVMASGAAERWFFIRYGDPDWHVRLRFQGAPERLLGEVLPALHAAVDPLMREGLLRKVVLDTYEREVERYGGDEGILLSERLFHRDSEAVLAILRMLSGDEGADARWRLALYGSDRLMADLGLDLEGKLRVMCSARDGMAREHRTDKDKRFEEQLSAKYRKERKALEELLREPTGHPLEPGLEVLRRRSEALDPVVAELKAREREGRLSESIEALAPSYVHMHVNRLLRGAHRAQELVLYDFLARLYESQAARARGRGARAT